MEAADTESDKLCHPSSTEKDGDQEEPGSTSDIVNSANASQDNSPQNKSEEESTVVSIDSDDDYANPEPPKELVEKHLLDADTIGDTVFSKHWLFSTLMKLIETVDKEEQSNDDSANNDVGLDLEEGLQDELCKLWDMSMNPEVVVFLMEFKAIDLLAGVIGKSKAPRAVEICVGILGNMACTERACYALSQNEAIRAATLLLLGSPDPPTLVETTRLLNICISSPSVSDLWLTSVKVTQAVINSFLFILQSSTNADLLTNTADVIDKLMDMDDILLVNWSTAEIVQAILEAIKQCGSRKDTVDTFLHILQLVSTCEAGIEALGCHSEALCQLTMQYLVALCSEDILVLTGQEDSVGSALSVLATAFTALDDKSGLLAKDFQMMRCLIKILAMVYPKLRHFSAEAKRQRSRSDSKCSHSRHSRSPSPTDKAKPDTTTVVNKENTAQDSDDSDCLEITGSTPATKRPDDGGVMEMLYEVLQNILTDVILVLSEDDGSAPDETNTDDDSSSNHDDSKDQKEKTPDSSNHGNKSTTEKPQSLVYLNDMCERHRLRILVYTLDEVNEDTELDCCSRLRQAALVHGLKRLDGIITQYSAG